MLKTGRDGVLKNPQFRSCVRPSRPAPGQVRRRSGAGSYRRPKDRRRLCRLDTSGYAGLWGYRNKCKVASRPQTYACARQESMSKVSNSSTVWLYPIFVEPACHVTNRAQILRCGFRKSLTMAPSCRKSFRRVGF